MLHQKNKGELKKSVLILLLLGAFRTATPQSVPASDENIPYLMTFGGKSETSWGDDDFLQIFFCRIPLSQTAPIYIRIYDPDTGNSLDELKGIFNTTVTFSVYGGPGCWSDTASQSINPKGNFKSGYLMSSKTFGMIRSTTGNGIHSDHSTLQKANTLRNSEVDCLKSLHRALPVMTAIFTGIS
jgi:hypothetical protein